MDITSIIVIIVIALAVGVVIGGLTAFFKLLLSSYKSLKQWKQKREVFENITPEEVINEEFSKRRNEIMQRPLYQPQSAYTQPSIQEPIYNYQDDLKRFNQANKELENLTEKYNKGKMSYLELKAKFESVQSQSYYRRILKSNYGKE